MIRVQFLAVLSCAALLFLGAGDTRPDAWPELPVDRFQVTFRDDFEALDISGARGAGARWYAHTPWNGDFGEAKFADPGPQSPFSRLPHGLRITARQGDDGRWRSGLISSKDAIGPAGGFSQRYGYFEIKARLPSGDGVWPAFWLAGVANPAPSPEVDIFEFYGRWPDAYRVTTHLWEGQRDRLNAQSVVRVSRGSLSDRYNLYGVWIQPDVTTFYFNRRPVAQQKTPPAFNRPFYILVDLALGGGWPVDQLKGEQYMDIEYVQAMALRP